MKLRFFYPVALLVLVTAACQNKPSGNYVRINAPEAGTIVKSGEDLDFDLTFDGGKADSIHYLVDSTVALRKTDTAEVKLSTKGLPLGNHLVTARIFNGGTPQELTSNIIVVSPTAPVPYTFEVVQVFPHDTSSYIEGLEYYKGFLYESDGMTDYKHGGSSLRKVEIRTGKVLQKVDLPPNLFAEGIAIIGDKILQLTWQNRLAIEYDKTTFKKLRELPYNAGVEGWGLVLDGNRLLTTEGSNSIIILNKDTYQKEGTIEVFDDKGPVTQLNELEIIDGKIYANVYGKPIIVIIDPATGRVENTIDLSSLLPKGYEDDMDYVLNGIAWDATGKRLFVTGKLWDKLYEIKVVKK